MPDPFMGMASWRDVRETTLKISLTFRVVSCTQKSIQIKKTYEEKLKRRMYGDDEDTSNQIIKLFNRS